MSAFVKRKVCMHRWQRSSLTGATDDDNDKPISFS